MDLKRNLTALIGLPLVVVLLFLGNKYVIDTLFMIIGLICMYEYYSVVGKVSHPIKWVGYLSTVIIAGVSLLEIQTTMMVVFYSIPIIMLILFLHVIMTNMKTTFKDVAYTFLGIMYIVFFIMFLSLITGLKNGNIYLTYTFVVAWSTDVFAYWIGRKWGKHKFSKISPKKSIEGCIAGMISAVLFGLAFFYISNRFFCLNLNISYIYVGIASLIYSVISQIGDFVASTIKRFADIKDYGTLLPGHGGMLDRIDSLIFIAPFVYMIVSLI